MALYFAVSDLGAVSVPVNWRLGPGEVEYILRDSGARLVVAEPVFASIVDKIAETLPSLEHKVAFDDAPAGWIPVASLAGAGPAPAIAVAADDVAIQMYTSGTTGLPKGALLTHRNLLSLTTSWLTEMPLAPGLDRFLQVTPLFHVGAVLMILSNVAAGSELLLLPEFAPGPAAAALVIAV